MKKFLNVLLVLALIGCMGILVGCGKQGEKYFSGTTWTGTWTTTTDTCNFVLKCEKDYTGSLTARMDSGPELTANFTWGAWVNKNNNNIPYVQITMTENGVSSTPQSFDLDKASNTIKCVGSYDYFVYIGCSYLGYTDYDSAKAHIPTLALSE